jgi:sulfotransferase 6B1
VTQIGSALDRHRWTLQRFGLSAAKAPYRILAPGAPRVMCVSIPKAGTHLLERALCLHPKLYRKIVPTITDEKVRGYGGLDRLLARVRPGQVIVSHLRFDARYPDIVARRARSIFLVRDPRDIVVSQVHYVSRTRGHRNQAFFAGMADETERLAAAIAGDRHHDVPSIAERLDAYAGWLSAGSLVVRFEDLVGPDGGGDRESQVDAVGSIFEFLGIDAGNPLIRSVCDRLFSASSPTFRRGAIGAWRSSFDARLEALFAEVAGQAIGPYPYELTGTR